MGKMIRILAVFIILLQAVTCIYSENVEIKIIHTNDMHGRVLQRFDKENGVKISGFASLKTLINREKLDSAIRGQEFYLFDIGDSFQGTIFSEYRKGNDVISLMNTLGYNLWVLGNHEFDFGQNQLRKLIEKSNFPVLCANLKHRGKDGNLISLDEYIKDFQIFDAKGVKIGVIGAITPDLLDMSVKKNTDGLFLLSTKNIINKNIRKLKKLGTNIIILASHMGVEIDEQVAKKCKGIDIIIGGHSHTFLEKPLNVNGVMIVQTGAYLVNAGRLEITYDVDKNKIVKMTDRLLKISNNNYPINFGIESKIDKMNKIASGFANKKLGFLKGDLLRKVPGLGIKSSDEVKKEFLDKYNNKLLRGCYLFSTSTKPFIVESNLCNFITDLMRKLTSSDVSMINPGGVRTNLNAGEIKYSDIYKVIPFANSITYCYLTGSQIESIMKKSGDMIRSGGLMFCSGLTCNFDKNRPSLKKVYNMKINGRKIIKNKLYKVATTNFTMMGGDGYEEFTKGKKPNDTGIILREAIKDYFLNNSPVSYGLDGRVKIEIE